MQRYANLNGDSGIAEYEAAPDSITVRFKDGASYLYTDAVTGKANVARMKELSAQGRGLNSFISQTVRERYARKWR